MSLSFQAFNDPVSCRCPAGAKLVVPPGNLIGELNGPSHQHNIASITYVGQAISPAGGFTGDRTVGRGVQVVDVPGAYACRSRRPNSQTPTMMAAAAVAAITRQAMAPNPDCSGSLPRYQRHSVSGLRCISQGMDALRP